VRIGEGRDRYTVAYTGRGLGRRGKYEGRGTDCNDSIPQSTLATDRHQDLVNLWTNITYSQTNLLQTDPWTVTLPSGVVPPPFQPVPGLDNAHNDVMGVTGGGVLTGGIGNDTFTFAPGFGQVTVTDFQPGVDIIQIDHLLFGSPNAAARHISADPFDPSHNAVITYDANNTISLHGVTADQLRTQVTLHGADYLFHIV
jgi:Ca2+-binding RTX toxin-like protein